MSDRGSNIGKNSSIQPGNWLGVFGGGQLGRMFTHAAQRLGYHVAVWEPESNCPAAQAADRHLQPSSPDEEMTAAKDLGNLCAAITIEFENTPHTIFSRIPAVASPNIEDPDPGKSARVKYS